MRRNRLPAACLLGALAALVLGCSERAPERRIVLITLDTLRHDGFFAVGDAAPPMPRTWRRLGDAARFTRHYASTSTTLPTHVSLLTALHPWQHAVTRNGLVLPEEVTTIPERLRASGWATAAVVASGPVTRTSGIAQGFERFDDDIVEERVLSTRRGERRLQHRYLLADTVTDRALAQLDATVAGRQFFWFHYVDAHDPYGDTRPSGRGITVQQVMQRSVDEGTPLLDEARRAHELYVTDLAFLDEHLDRLLARLEADATGIETHVVVVSDHGESFGEDGSLSHGRRVTDVQVRVPLLVVSPRIAAGEREDANGSVDVAATLLAFADLAADQGRDLTHGPAADARAFGMRRTFAETERELRTDGRFHELPDWWFFAADVEGLVRGNGEELEPVPEDPEHARALRDLFTVFRREVEGAAVEEIVDEATLEALRELGYVE